jgi:hypothetical protein
MTVATVHLSHRTTRIGKSFDKFVPAPIQRSDSGGPVQIPEERKAKVEMTLFFHRVSFFCEEMLEMVPTFRYQLVGLLSPTIAEGFDESLTFETLESRVQGAKRDAPEPKIGEPPLEFVSVEGCVSEKSEYCEVEHVLPHVSIRYILYRTDTVPPKSSPFGVCTAAVAATRTDFVQLRQS